MKKGKKKMIYIVILAIILYLIYVIYLLIKQPTDIFTLEEGKLYLEETNVGYLIRNEQIIKGENYKNGMEQIKTEGEKVAKNEPVFRYYSQNEDNLKEKISDLDFKIQEAMAQENGIYSSDIKLIENQIDQKVLKLHEMTDVSKMIEYKKEIDSLINKKADIAGEKSPKGSYLSQLIDERRNYENQLNSGAEYVNAPISGLTSYKVDGLEDTLKATTECFSTLSKEYLESLNLKTGKIIATNEECGKIIDNTECYIATISSSEKAKEAEVGNKVKIRLSNNSEIPAEINYIIKEDETLLILKIEKEIEELLNYRKISFDLIWWSSTGLKVPNQAIVESEGLKYVVRKRAGYLNKILVKVKKIGENYSIVDSYSVDELKQLGFSNQEINSYKKISLYDEILLNPRLDKLDNSI